MTPGPPGPGPPATRSAQLRTEIPGPRSRALSQEEAAYLAPGIQAISTLAGLAFDHGEGALLTDVDGNTFIDFVAGIGVASIGHGHPALRQALADQAGRLSVGSFPSAPRLELLRRIAQNAPAPGLVRTQLYSGGAEAVESALRLARAHTGKHEIIAFWGGFHGKTGGVLGLLGSEFKHGLGPLLPGQHLAPYADCARCPFGLRLPACGLHCADFLRQVIRYQTAGGVAAILVEPVQGTAGNIVPPPGWLEAVQQVAREAGALLIVDEMITGWGRTGRLWGQQHTGAAGDIVTFGKGVAAGYPISGLISRDEIVAARPWSSPSFSSSSYGGNPLGAAAAAAVTRIIVDERLDEHAARAGAALQRGLAALAERHQVVGAVRGQGLLLGFDLVRDRRSGELLPRPLCERLFQECLRRGLLSMTYTPRVRINPPLVISLEQVEEGLAILDEALSAL